MSQDVPAFNPCAFVCVKDIPHLDAESFGVDTEGVFCVPPDAEWCVLKAEHFPEKTRVLYNITYEKGDILLCLRHRVADKTVRMHVLAKLDLTDARMLAIQLAYASIGPEV